MGLIRVTPKQGPNRVKIGTPVPQVFADQFAVVDDIRDAATASATSAAASATAAQAAADAAAVAEAAAFATVDTGTAELISNPTAGPNTQAALTSAMKSREDAVYLSDYGVTGNGTTDDTTTIQNAVDAAAAAGKPVRVMGAAGKTYSVKRIKLRTGVVLDLGGATLKKRDGSASCVIESPGLTGGEHIDNAGIVNAVIDCNGYSYGAVWIKDATNITVQNVRMFGFVTTSATGIKLDADTSACKVRDNTITLTLDDPFGTVPSGVGINCSSVVVDSQSGGQNATLTFSEPTNLSTGHTIANNTIYGGTHGISLAGASRIIISGNIITGQGHRGIILSPRCTDNTIVGNTLRDFNSTGIHLAWGSIRNTIVGNTLRTSKSANEGDGIKGYFGCSRNTVVGNYVEGVANGGVRFAVGSMECTISGNVLVNNKIGVLLQSKLDTPYYNPTSLAHTIGHTVAGNMITGNLAASPVGIQLEAFGTPQINRVTLTGNSIKTCSSGVKIIEQTANTVAACSATGNLIDATTKWDTPRNRSHFLVLSGNEGIEDMNRQFTVLSQVASDPANPPSSDAALFVRLNGTSGKRELCVRFATGAAVVIAAQA